MDCWDTPANILEASHSSDGRTGYTLPFVHGPNTDYYSNGLESNNELPRINHTPFEPGFNSDLIIVTNDHLDFHLDIETLFSVTNNNFNQILNAHTPGHREEYEGKLVFTIPETSTVFAMVVCAIYGLPYADYDPSFKTLDQAVDAMKTYGVAIEKIITPGTLLFDILLSHAESRSLELYALAAHNGLHALAVAASFYLVSYQLSSLSDEVATRIGPLYLKRLFFMHLGRAEALRRFLLPTSYLGQPTTTCKCKDQPALTRAWALASSSLVWDMRDDLSTEDIFAALNPLGVYLTCETCKKGLEDRIDTLTQQWAATKRSI